MSATHRGIDRIPQDFYSTPLWAIKLILDRIDLSAVKSSCEPCRGSGFIYRRLPGQRSHAELSEGLDYLTIHLPFVDLIVTNPPFSLALEFLTRSMTHASTVIYLLRLNFLGSRKRKYFFARYPLTHLYVLSRRPSFILKRTDATEYAWFVWDLGQFMKDDPGIYIL